MKNGCKSLVAAISLTLSGAAQADTYCGGAPVPRILTYNNGSVLVITPWRGDFFMICNLNEPWKGVSPSVCFAWMSQITNAIIENKPVGFWYSGDVNCSTIPHYGQAPAPVYVDVAQ